MDGSSATIHWHGMTQKRTPYSDGVPFITQCPIHFGNKFRYTFEANDAGTNFYHGHCGLQKVNGLYGAIIVRLPKESNLYDHDLRDFKLVVSDWMHTYANFFLGFPSLTISSADTRNHFFQHFQPEHCFTRACLSTVAVVFSTWVSYQFFMFMERFNKFNTCCWLGDDESISERSAGSIHSEAA